MNGNASQTLWKECLAAAFGAGDATLTTVLMAEPTSSLEECECIIRAFAQNAGIEKLNSQVLVTHSGPTKSSIREPPLASRIDWAEGRIVSSFEHGVELHPAFLSLARDATERLGRRLWRTQSSTLMPLADQVRLRVCDYLVDRYGKKWFERLGVPPQEPRELDRLRVNPFDADLGYLVSLNRKIFLANRCGYDHDFLESVRLMRNDLAHYKPVDMSMVRRVLAGM